MIVHVEMAPRLTFCGKQPAQLMIAALTRLAERFDLS